MAPASREHAQRLLNALRRTATRIQPRDLAIVVGRVVAVLLFLELVYVAAGNVLLRTQLIQRAVSSSEGFTLEFTRAYTLWPGHAHVEGVSLRVEDYNVQFEVAIDRAELDIALGQLPFKKFLVTRLDAEGTRFRMRHKLITVGDDGERVAAFPPIKGFADPPYYVGVRSPAIPDADYDLWQVKIENVTARVRELWVMEYRFVGAGEARGSFVVKPARWVQVEPARLRLDDGRLTLGSHLVAEHVRGHITCDIPDMRVQETEGAQVLRDISTTLSLSLEGGTLDFLGAYLARLGSATYAGRGDFSIEANVQRGVIQPGTHVSVRALPLRVRYDALVAAGDVSLVLQRPAPSSLPAGSRGDELWLAVDAPRLAFERSRSDATPPSVERVVGSLQLHAADLKQPTSLGPARLSVGKALAPSLAWFAQGDWRPTGKAEARFDVQRDPGGALTADARLDASGTLAHGKKRSGNFTASVATRGLRSDPGAEWKTRGELDVRAVPLRSLLPLLVANPLDDVADAALDLEALQARLALELDSSAFQLRVIDARSGRLRMRGYLGQGKSQPRGAFLLSSGPINVGVTVQNGDTEVSPFVSDNWLTAAREPGAG